MGAASSPDLQYQILEGGGLVCFYYVSYINVMSKWTDRDKKINRTHFVTTVTILVLGPFVLHVQVSPTADSRSERLCVLLTAST